MKSELSMTVYKYALEMTDLVFLQESIKIRERYPGPLIRGPINCRDNFRNSFPIPIPSLVFTAFFQHPIIDFVHTSQIQFFSPTFRHFALFWYESLDDLTNQSDQWVQSLAIWGILVLLAHFLLSSIYRHFWTQGPYLEDLLEDGY